jgi:predicted neuraminidase
VLFALSPGREDLVLHFKVGSRIRDWETWAQRSSDSGRTWSTATRLVPGDHGGRGAVRNKPIQLSSGSWLAGASIERWRSWDAFIDRSPNGLDGWVASDKIQIDRRNFSGKGLIQPALWESTPGIAHALFRSTDGRTHRSDSEDDGQSWSKAYPIDVPNNNSGLDLTRMHDGTLALVCNPVAGNWAARTPLSVLFSKDNGESWPERLDIETEPGEFSYPSIIEIEDGLMISYTWNRRRIAVARITAIE